MNMMIKSMIIYKKQKDNIYKNKKICQKTNIIKTYINIYPKQKQKTLTHLQNSVYMNKFLIKNIIK